MRPSEKSKRLSIVLGIILVLVLLGTLFLLSNNKRKYVSKLSIRDSQVSYYSNKAASASSALGTVEKNAATEITKAENNNTSPDSKRNKELNSIVKIAFSGMYNFTPNNFKTRYKRVENSLTADLMTQYFPHNSDVSSSNVYSKLISVDCYPRSEQSSALKALVSISYKTHYGTESDKSKRALWIVSYDTHKKQLTKITSAANGGW